MFNEQQLDIINLKNSRISVLAAAGTGKSTTVAGRVVKEIKDGIPENKIAIITFTNEACDSIKDHLVKNNVETSTMIVQTLHAFCYRIYKSYCEYNHKRLPKPISSPYKAFSSSFWKLTAAWKGMPNKNLRQILANIVSWQLAQLTPEKLIADVQEFEGTKKRSILELKKEAISDKSMIRNKEYEVMIWNEYEIFKKTNNHIDFTDMLTLAVDALANCPQTLALYRRRIKTLMIDEFQDTNALVLKVMQHLVTENMDVVLVGDLRQSVYSFLNARPDLSVDYMNENSFTKLSLQTNYRSGKTIVENANTFISNYPTVNMGGAMICGRPEIEAHVFSKVSECELTEKHTVIELLEDLKAQGFEYKDIALLYRTNAQAMLMLDHCVTKDIPFVIKRDGASIFSRGEMKDIFTYLKFFNCPELTTVEDIKRIGNKPSRYISNASYAGIRDSAFGRNLINGDYDGNQNLKRLSVELSRLYRSAKGLSLSDQINYIAYESGVGYIAHWEKANLNDSLFDISLYFNCLASLVETFDTYPKLIKQVNKIKRALKDRNETEGLNFYSIHSSKGLEFPVVIVLGVCDRIYPFFRAVAERGQEGHNEEARLFYVASTRPEKLLYYSEIVGDFGNKKVKESPFIKQTNRILLNPYPTEQDNGKEITEAFNKRVGTILRRNQRSEDLSR